jgi:hypothetical protein
MAQVGDQVQHHAVRDHRSGPGSGRHHGRDYLAEIIMIRQPSAPRAGLLGSLVTKARVFASPRTQATSVRSTPHPPSSPALRLLSNRSHTPNDAA